MNLNLFKWGNQRAAVWVDVSLDLLSSLLKYLLHWMEAKYQSARLHTAVTSGNWGDDQMRSETENCPVCSSCHRVHGVCVFVCLFRVCVHNCCYVWTLQEENSRQSCSKNPQHDFISLRSELEPQYHRPKQSQVSLLTGRLTVQFIISSVPRAPHFGSRLF